MITEFSLILITRAVTLGVARGYNIKYHGSWMERPNQQKWTGAAMSIAD